MEKIHASTTCISHLQQNVLNCRFDREGQTNGRTERRREVMTIIIGGSPPYTYPLVNIDIPYMAVRSHAGVIWIFWSALAPWRSLLVQFDATNLFRSEHVAPTLAVSSLGNTCLRLGNTCLRLGNTCLRLGNTYVKVRNTRLNLGKRLGSVRFVHNLKGTISIFCCCCCCCCCCYCCSCSCSCSYCWRFHQSRKQLDRYC